MNELDLLEIQDSEAVQNTYYRYPKVTPHINKFPTYVEIKTINASVNIYKLEETILYIIADFKWTPAWMIKQWYADYNKNGYEIISNWIQVGIVWAEPSSMGAIIRPTKFLFDLMKIDEKQQNYIDVTFNLVNHTCAEEQMVFDIMMGNPKSELWNILQQAPLLPCYHPLDIKVANDSGTIVVREGLFSINRYKEQELIERQDKLKKDIMTKKPFTMEFQDFTLFPIVAYDDKNKLVTQKPDVIVPIPRKEGLPQSCSIELELTAKNADKYDGIMRNYKNNLTFGRLYYLCGNRRIANLVVEAYKKIGGLGTCKLFIVPYKAPAQQLENMTLDDEESQKKMLKLTINNTKEGN